MQAKAVSLFLSLNRVEAVKKILVTIAVSVAGLAAYDALVKPRLRAAGVVS